MNQVIPPVPKKIANALRIFLYLSSGQNSTTGEVWFKYIHIWYWRKALDSIYTVLALNDHDVFVDGGFDDFKASDHGLCVKCSIFGLGSIKGPLMIIDTIFRCYSKTMMSSLIRVSTTSRCLTTDSGLNVLFWCLVQSRDHRPSPFPVCSTRRP